jgi:hypothetical protein
MKDPTVSERATDDDLDEVTPDVYQPDIDPDAEPPEDHDDLPDDATTYEPAP